MSTPPYYPPGWNKDRWQSATGEDYDTLTDEQIETFHAGLRADLGEEGAEDYYAEIDLKKGPRPLREYDANFILRPRMDYFGEYPEWGFVVYRTAGYGGNDDVIQQVKLKIEALLDDQFDRALPKEDVQRAREKFRLMWFESEDLDGATPEEIARRNRELSEPPGVKLPYQLSHSLCLCVDDWSIRSILQEDSKKFSAHVLAVANSCGEKPTYSCDETDDDRWTGSFKVAVETLVSELFPGIGGGSDRSPYEIGVGITPDLVRTDGSRYGMKKAYVDGPVVHLKWEGRVRVR